jgi:hypothetical protein
VVLPPPPNRLLPPPLPVGVLAPPKSGLVCCWLLLVPNGVAPAALPGLGVFDPKLKAMLEIWGGAIR